MLVVEDLPRLDVSDFKGLPMWPEVEANREATIHMHTGDAVIVVELSFLTDTTVFGTRYWLACPSCGDKRKHLYLEDGRLACRACLGALYRREAWPDSTWRREVGRPALRAWNRLPRLA